MITLRVFVSLLADTIRHKLNDSHRRSLQREMIRQEMDEYSRNFRQEEYTCVHQRVEQALDFLGPQYEQDMEELPKWTPEQFLEEMQHLALVGKEIGLPFIFGAQMPGYSRIYMASNIMPAHTDTQIMCAYHDLSR